MRSKYCVATRENAEILMKMLGYKFKDNYSLIGGEEFPFLEMRNDSQGKNIHLMNYVGEVGYSHEGQTEPDEYVSKEGLLDIFKQTLS